MFVYFYCS
jgi:hypothetical protein